MREMLPLDQFAEINPRMPKQLGDADEVAFLAMQSVSEDGNITHQETRLFSDVRKGFTYFQRGDVLLAKITPCFENGKSASTNKLSHQVGFGSTEFHVLRAIPQKTHSKYLFHLVRSKRFRFLGQKSMKGAAGHKRVPVDFLKGYEVPDWPLDDQIRIAHLLGKVEGLITQRKQQLQQLDDLLKSVFLEMFGPTSAGYEAWPLVEIRELAAKHKGAMRTGPFGSNLLHSEFTPEGDVAVLGIDNAVQNRFAWGESRFISSDKYQELQSYRIFPGDVIVTIMGTIGRSAVIPDDVPLAINTKHLAAITLDREVANPLFLSHSIHSSPFVLKQFASKNRGAIMSGLNLGIIKETKIKCPPIGLQNRFADIHTRVDQLKSRYQQSLTDLENLYGALSQKAFKGELDLSRVPRPVDQVPATEPLPLDEDMLTPTEVVNHLMQSAPPESRSKVLANWFNRYLTNSSPDITLGSREFLESAWQVLQESRLETEGETPALELTDYDELKNLVFATLEDGVLMQTFDDASNRVSLQRRPSDWGAF